MMNQSSHETASGFKALFQPGKIGNLDLENRLIMAAMGNALADNHGNVTGAMEEYYRSRAAGGVGMVITQCAAVSRDDVMPYNPGIYDDSFIPGLKKLINVIHDQGARACIQLMHPGMLFLLLKPFPSGLVIKVPSITPAMPGDKPFKVLEQEDIDKYIQDFAAAALRAKEAGADAVELHACHGCLLSTFLSPAVNRRKDQYGGSVENRTRFVKQIVEAIKQKTGPDFPLIVRINGKDDVEGGVTPEEVVSQAGILSAAGADAISISSGLEYWSTLMAPSYLSPAGVVISVANEVKKSLNVPVIVSGKIDPELAERTLSESWADFIALGRPLLADPGLPGKLRRNALDEVTTCIYCNNCLRTSWRSCTVNPFLFRESTASLSPTTAPKKIMVIGGGLAGLKAAALCKMKGHDVSLFEKEPLLGGQWLVACSLPGKEDYIAAIDKLKYDLEKLQVPVTLNQEVTPELVSSIKPDIAIIATGARPASLDIPGADGPNVLQANDIIKGAAYAEGKTIVIGGNHAAMETAIFLVEEGYAVSLVSRSGLGGRQGPDDMITFRGLVRGLIQHHIPIHLNARILEITPGSVVVDLNGEIVPLPCETVVLAVGVRPDDALAGQLKGLVPEIYTIGDCVVPGNAAQATYSAARLALKL